MDWNIVLLDPLRAMLIRVGAFLPKLVALLVILIVGWLIAKLIQVAIARALKLIRLDTLSDKSGLSNLLAKGGVKYSLSELLGILVYWLAMLIVIMAALNLLNLTVAAELLNRAIAYIPRVIASIFILVIGMYLAALISAIVRTTASNAGIGQARLLGKLAQIVLVVFAITVALEQLEIGTLIITSVINIVLASLGLGMALAFGLGCKDIAGRFMSDIIEKLKK